MGGIHELINDIVGSLEIVRNYSRIKLKSHSDKIFKFVLYHFDFLKCFYFPGCNDSKSILCSALFSLILGFLYHSKWTEEHSSGRFWMTCTYYQLYKIRYRLVSDHSIIIETHLVTMNTHDYSSPIITTGHYQIWLRSIVAISQSTAIWSSDLGLMQCFCCSLFESQFHALIFLWI